MAKRRTSSDRTLDECQTEWRKSGKKNALRKALACCRERRLPEPAWLRNAFYRLGRELVMKMKKTGRSMNLLSDDMLYATVEDYRRDGLTQEKAWELTALEFFGDRNRNYTVKSTWLRHQKRIVKGGIPPEGFENVGPWHRIKKEYIEQDKDAKWYTKGMNPPPRRTKNK